MRHSGFYHFLIFVLDQSTLVLLTSRSHGRGSQSPVLMMSVCWTMMFTYTCRFLSLSRRVFDRSLLGPGLVSFKQFGKV